MFLIRQFDPEIHHRRSIRLRGYDYTAPGAYFITICSEDRPIFFGNINNGHMKLNAFGQIVENAWHDLPNHNPQITMDAFVVMPDHIHGIVIIRDAAVGAGPRPAPCMGYPQPPMGAGPRPAPCMGGPQPPMGAGLEPAPTDIVHHGLPEIIRQFKSFSARRINKLRGSPGKPVWQRNYYEHIIRTENDLQRIRTYINENPSKYQGCVS